MLRSVRLLVIGLLALCASVGAYAGSMTAPTGYGCFDTVFSMPAGASFGGFDILPNGNFAIHDGYSLREIDRFGNDVNTLYSYPGFVYGSFVKYNQADGRVYFGDSSYASNKIYSVAADGSDLRMFTTLKWNYDMDFSNGKPYIVAGNGLYTVDGSSTDPVLIAEVGLVSGALAFDSAGDLFYGTGEWGWPPASNAQDIYRWSAAEVAAADGENMLVVDAGHVFRSGVDGPSGFVFGRDGLLYSDAISSPGQIRLLSGGTDSLFAECTGPDTDPTTLRYDAVNDRTYAAVTWYDEIYNKHAMISTIAVPEPSSILVLSSLIGLVASPGLLRRRRK